MARKQPWSTASPDGPWDAIVIGSGPGGLGAAAALAQLGWRVLVLEQHYVAGGYTHTFVRRSFRWDIGVHVVGEQSVDDGLGRLFSVLTEGRLRWNALGEVVDRLHMPDGRVLDVPAGASALAEAIPEAGDAVMAYLRRVKLTAASVMRLQLYRSLPPELQPLLEDRSLDEAREALAITAEEVLASYFPDPDTRRVMGMRWAYHGMHPSRAPFGIQAAATQHYVDGCYYPVGGASRIAWCLAETVRGAGGWTRLRAPVAEVLTRGGRARGVALASGEIIEAPLVISAAGAVNTLRLLPERLRESDWARAVEALPMSRAHEALYLGLEGDIAAAGATRAAHWLVNPDPASTHHLYLSFSSLRDPEHRPGPRQRHVATALCMLDPEGYQRWADRPHGDRSEDYQAHKAAVGEAFRRRVLAALPGLEPMIAREEISTPLTAAHFNGAPGGAIYGLAASRERYALEELSAWTPLEGLLLAGSDVSMNGVLGALVGGVYAAIAAAGMPALSLLLRATMPSSTAPRA